MINRTKTFAATVGCFLISMCAGTPVHSRDLHPGCAEDLIEEARRAKLVAPYAPRPGGYCDGQAPSLHAGYLELQSLTDGPLQFDSTRLEVSVAAKGDYWLRGRDLRPDGKYRLDGPLPEGRLSIDIAAAILPLELQADKIGLYALKQDDGQEVHAPVSSGRPGTITAIFRYPGRIGEVLSATLCQSTVPNCTVQVAFSLQHHPSGTALISLSFPKVAIPGRYRLFVTAKKTRPVPVFGLIHLDL